MRTLLLSATVSALVVSSALGWAQSFDQPVGSPTSPKIDRTKVYIDQNLGAHIPEEASFLDREGHEVRVAGLLHSRPLLVLPIFYRCKGVCSLEFTSLVNALPKLKEKIGKDFDVLVLSIDPNEGPKLAQQKLDMAISMSPELEGTQKGWHFYTGPLDSIHKVTNALGFHYTYDAEKDLINHPSGIMFVTPDGVVSGYVLGADYKPTVLSADLELAGKSRIGKKTPDVFFGCIHIDPITGQRSIVIENVLKVAGLATILAISCTIGFLSVGKKMRRRRMAN